MKVGIISFAHMHAFSYANHLVKHPDVELAGIWDDNEERGEKVAANFNSKYYHSLDELLQTDIEAVVICSENANHREHVVKAARAKKHILCEKPIATTVDDAEVMIRTCEEENVLLQIAYPVRFAPAIKEAKRLIDEGAIGKVLSINGTNHGQMPGGWFIEKELSGGGSATDHIVHVMDLIRWILKDEVKSVYAELDTHFYDIDVEDAGSVLLELESGVIVSIDPSWSRPKSFPTWGDVTMVITGTEGTLAVDAFKEHSVYYSGTSERIQQLPFGADMDEGLVKDFIQTVKENREPFISGLDGLRTLEVVKAAYESTETKKMVTLKKRVFS